jgi:SAM-dependent methyltransferase
MTEETKKDYRAELSVKNYHKLTGFEGDWRDTWWNDEFLAMMAQQWGLEKVKTILDVGCGVGHWGQRLMRHLSDETKLFGIDPESAWIKEAEVRSTKLGIADRSEFKIGKVESLPFADNCFDMVTCQTVLIHVADLKVAIEEMIRVLKPGGLFLCAEPNNFGNTAAHYVENPLLDWDQLSGLLELEYKCTIGKFKVGEGHQSAGQLVPSVLHECGMNGVQIKNNNQCALVAPPYADLGAKTMVKYMRNTNDSGAAMVLGGTEENCKRYFLAGGGQESKFAQLWDMARNHLQETINKIDNGTYISAGGHLHYVVWGYK